MNRATAALALLLVLAGALTPPPAQAPAPVYLAVLNRDIDFLSAQYVGRALDEAQRGGAQALIIQLDTPGGTSDAMREICDRLLASPVPVIVYVAPPGARAASAGTFITVAADVAAMAPSTHLGAAHPVDASGANLPTELDRKATNDSATYIRDLARAHGHNADWAERAVRESVVASADEALSLGVVDLIANDTSDLLRQLDGREVRTAQGTVTLHTLGAPLQTVDMTVGERAVALVADPNIAFVLLIVGLIGLVIEFYHPGGFLPGIAGVVCLVLALVGLGSLPVNWAGVGLIVLGIVLFIVDLHVTGFGLTIAGAVALVLGALLLFQPLPFAPPEPQLTALRFAVSPWLIGATTLGLIAFFVFGLSAALRMRRMPVKTGAETLVGAQGIAATDLTPDGLVNVHAEDWTATSVSGPVPKGTPVRIVAVEGLRLRVSKD